MHYGKKLFRKKKEKGTEYTTARVYAFSKEIPVLYSIYHDSTGCFAKAYYASTKNPYVPSIRGKSLTKRTRKGLHAKTVDEVIALLEMVPYARLMSEAITIDIRDSYLKKGISVTLKTLWFCLRSSLLKKTSYDDAVMVELFSGCNTISDLYPDRDSSEPIKRAVDELLEEGEEIKEMKILNMLNLVVSEAINKEYLSENRILPLIPAARNRATKRQAEVRQALTKRCFEPIEEDKMVKYLLPFCVKSSKYLAVLIRLMTGISIKEVCGLLWSDFKYNADTKVFTLCVTKFVDSSGKITHHILQDNWEKYRVLPLPIVLGKTIQARKELLIKEGLNAQVLEDYPIILPKEDLYRMKKGYRPIYCKTSSVAEKCREVVKRAEIPQLQVILPDKEGQEIEADLNNYIGDIYRTNFRDKALNLSGFDLGELHYYLGLKKPDTFSQHYCDYTNPYIQLEMARKLDRWGSRYEIRTSAQHKNRGGTYSISGIDDGVPCVYLDIKRNDKNYEPIMIQVESTHGFDVSVSSYKRKE